MLRLGAREQHGEPTSRPPQTAPANGATTPPHGRVADPGSGPVEDVLPAAAAGARRGRDGVRGVGGNGGLVRGDEQRAVLTSVAGGPVVRGRAAALPAPPSGTATRAAPGRIG